MSSKAVAPAGALWRGASLRQLELGNERTEVKSTGQGRFQDLATLRLAFGLWDWRRQPMGPTEQDGCLQATAQESGYTGRCLGPAWPTSKRLWTAMTG